MPRNLVKRHIFSDHNFSDHKLISEIEERAPRRSPSDLVSKDAGSIYKPAIMPKLSYSNAVVLMALLVSVPSLGVAEVLLWTASYSAETKWGVTLFLLVTWVTAGLLVRGRIMHPLRTLSNMAAGIREGDFSFRIRGGDRRDAVGELLLELNALSETLQQKRQGALEATALLKKVLMEIDVAVFTFDPKSRLRIVNRAGERLMALTSEKMLGRTAQEMNLDELLNFGNAQTIQRSFPGKEGRWAIQHTAFREAGVPHELLIISDLSRALREEEREAWQRLIRVLGHELNNSLAPIKSIAGTLSMLASRQPAPPDLTQDVQRGLRIIEGRADSLSRFMQAYTKLAKLPALSRKDTYLPSLIRSAAFLETRLAVEVLEGEPLTIHVDPDQLEQLLINIIRNAVDATLEASPEQPGGVQVSWGTKSGVLHVWVRDEGPGLLNSKNIFVPFFTTKTGGSGIGLALSRQIAEAHGGSVTLKNRDDRRGCEAELRVPLTAQ